MGIRDLSNGPKDSEAARLGKELFAEREANKKMATRLANESIAAR